MSQFYSLVRTVFSKSFFSCRTAVWQTAMFCRTKPKFGRTVLYVISIISVIFVGHLSDRTKCFVRQNEILPVLTDRLALFMKTVKTVVQKPPFSKSLFSETPKNIYDYVTLLHFANILKTFTNCKNTFFEFCVRRGNHGLLNYTFEPVHEKTKNLGSDQV